MCTRCSTSREISRLGWSSLKRGIYQKRSWFSQASSINHPSREKNPPPRTARTITLHHHLRQSRVDRPKNLQPRQAESGSPGQIRHNPVEAGPRQPTHPAIPHTIATPTRSISLRTSLRDCQPCLREVTLLSRWTLTRTARSLHYRPHLSLPQMDMPRLRVV